jgi:uncharacterized SAM-binding protein YcdF (DUF218 family)
MLRPVKKYIVVLANEMDSAGVLNQESAARADLAGSLALLYPMATLVTPGWAYRSDSSVRIGSVMRDYLVEHFDIPASRIVSHLDSKDTVGDAVYCREFLDTEEFQYSLDVVTSDYHCKRAFEIFSFVFGDLVDIEVHPVHTGKNLSSREAEESSTEAFQRTFRGVSPGDLNAIKKRLVESHPLYGAKNSGV